MVGSTNFAQDKIKGVPVIPFQERSLWKLFLGTTRQRKPQEAMQSPQITTLENPYKELGPPKTKPNSANPARPSQQLLFRSYQKKSLQHSDPHPNLFATVSQLFFTVSQLVPSFSLFSMAPQLVPNFFLAFPNFLPACSQCFPN